MTYDERSIRCFLRGYPGQFVSPRVIARRVGGKRRCYDDPQWALPLLQAMVEKGTVETDAQGHYRLKKQDLEQRAGRMWVSPQYRQILERSSRDFSKVIQIDLDDDDELPT